MEHRILVVDDDVVDRQIAMRALRAAGIHSDIVEVANGNDAVSAVMSEEFDCILLDFRLPGMNGFDVLEKIKPHIEEHLTPTIMMTSYQDEAQAVEAINHGATNFIQKDQITPNVLSRAVKSAIELKALRSERRDAEVALRQKQALLESAQQMASLGAWQYCLNNRTSVWSDGLHQIYGGNPDTGEPTRETIEAFFDQKDLEKYRNTCRQVIATKRRQQIRQNILTVTGAVRTVDHIINAVTDDSGNVVQLTGIVQDITDRLKSEEALMHAQRMDSLGQLSGGIAHDFNNLLGILVGHLGLLKRAVQGQEALEYRVETLIGVADRGTRLVQRLLQFSKNEKSAAEIVNVNALLVELDEMLSKFLTSQVEVRMDLGENIRPILADRGELDDAIINLCVNARDAMPDGGEIVVSTRNAPLNGERKPSEAYLAPGDYVVVSVSDNGIGMPQHVIDRAFEPFFTTKERGKGTGLGLSMVYGFAKRNCGTILIDSVEGEGTTINIYLPSHTADDVAIDDEEQTAVVDQATPDRTNVLIVEDEADLTEIASDMLSGAGYGVLTARSADAAVRLLENGPGIDIVFTDVIMPGGKSGFDLAREVSGRWPTVKIVLASGFTGECRTESIDPTVLQKILRKPYKLPDVLNAIEEAVPAAELMSNCDDTREATPSSFDCHQKQRTG